MIHSDCEFFNLWPNLEEAPNTLPKLAVLLWSSASLGLDAGHLCAEVSERLRHREGQVLDVRQMADLAWALSMLPSDSTTMVSLQHLQWLRSASRALFL